MFKGEIIQISYLILKVSASADTKNQQNWNGEIIHLLYIIYDTEYILSTLIIIDTQMSL